MHPKMSSCLCIVIIMTGFMTCPSLEDRLLSITGKTYILELYADGVFQPLTSDGQWATADNTTLSDDNRLIALAVGDFSFTCPGLLASVTNDFLVTDGTWKCTATLHSNWNTLGFDDSGWNETYVIGANGGVTSPEACSVLTEIPAISSNAFWIWTNSLVTKPNYDQTIYCRGYLPICGSGPCQNGGTCNSNDANVCICLPQYTGTYCEIERQNYLKVTSHDSLSEVYIDGIRGDLPNANDMNSTDSIIVPSLSRLISVMAVSTTDSCAALIASVTESQVATDASWKCSTYCSYNWFELGFDDSSWPFAFNLGKNGDVPQCNNLIYVPGISAEANWIWTEYAPLQPKESDKAVFCRGYIPTCQNFVPCQNGGTCLDNSKELCKCASGWTGTYCDQVYTLCFNNPCLNNGTCVVIVDRYECRCSSGYIGINCDKEVSIRNLTVTAKQTIVKLYVDGVEQSLEHRGEWNVTDVLTLSAASRMVAVMATDLTQTCAGILASVSDDYLVTDATWKCNRTVTGYPADWYQHGYDDFQWKNAFVIGVNGNVTTPASCSSLTEISSISKNAFWIWTESMTNAPNYDDTIYCRGYLPTCIYDNPCRNGGACNRNHIDLCSCVPGFTGTYCENILNRTLTITAKSSLLELHIDGVQMEIPNYDKVNLTDDVYVQPFGRLIAVMALDYTNTCPGILASVSEDYLVTDATWKCIFEEQALWNTLGFDDSQWPIAFVIGPNGGEMVFPECSVLPQMPSISSSANWIWTNFNLTVAGYQPIAYCRAYLPLCELNNPCYNGGTCNRNSPTICTCLIGFTGTYCEYGATKTLMVTAEKALNAVYIDGMSVTLTNGDNSASADGISIKSDARLIAVMAVKLDSNCPGILASVNDSGDYLLTGSHWKCTSNTKFGWFNLGFDDSAWSNAVAIQPNYYTEGALCPEMPQVLDISSNAYWIWTNSLPTHDVAVYCRGYLPTCTLTTCSNGGTCNSNSPLLCTCPPGYTGVHCELDALKRSLKTRDD